MPDRSSSAGDSSEPQATTTRGAFTVTWALRPSGGCQTASTPAARPPSVETSVARVKVRKRAPCSCASASQVRSALCLLPDWSPKPRYAAVSGE